MAESTHPPNRGGNRPVSKPDSRSFGIRYQFDINVATNATSGIAFAKLARDAMGPYRVGGTLELEVLDAQSLYDWKDIRCLYLIGGGKWVYRWQAKTEAGELWLMTNQPPESVPVS